MRSWKIWKRTYVQSIPLLILFVPFAAKLTFPWYWTAEHMMLQLVSLSYFLTCQHLKETRLNIEFSFWFQHATHLEGLLRENRTLSTSDIHDSGVRTLCISELKTVDLEKVLLNWLLDEEAIRITVISSASFVPAFQGQVILSIYSILCAFWRWKILSLICMFIFSSFGMNKN